MNSWKHIPKISIAELAQTRKSLHQVVQIVSAFPRNTLSHDPTDGLASLIWNENLHCLESLPFQTSTSAITAGLSLADYSLKIFTDGHLHTDLSMKDQSIADGLNWLRKELAALDVDSQKIDLELPYEIERVDDQTPLAVHKSALEVYSCLYSNTQLILEKVINNWQEAFDIRCWPHHFDMATLIPLQQDAKGEILKSIGAGLSPSDEGINEPYFYVNIWPSVAYQKLNEYPLSKGQWNESGWSGAVLTYSDFSGEDHQEDLFEKFVFKTIKTLAAI